MDWSKVYSYCERGGDPSFWAEPLNAISNGAFVIAGLIAAWQLARSPRSGHALFEWMVVLAAIAIGTAILVFRAHAPGAHVLGALAIAGLIIGGQLLHPASSGGTLFERLLIGLVVAIGIGSFMFHTYATVWAIPFDTIPISLFMLAYLGYALRRFAGVPWILVIAALIGFYLSVRYAQGIQCSNELLPMTRGAGKRCFNGTLGYTPAFGALVLVGALLLVQGHRAAGYLFAAAFLFIAAMTFRTIDLEVCTWTVRAGRGVGTHFLWHTLNGLLLYVLLLGAIRHGAPKDA